MSVKTLKPFLANEERETPPTDDDEIIFAKEDDHGSDEVIFAEEDDEESIAAGEVAIAHPLGLTQTFLEMDCNQESWVVLSVDDQIGIREAIKMILADFKFEDKPLQVLEASSEREARAIIKERPELALMFVDVVMERDDSGLQLVRYIREELGNTAVRIVLLTGQPGQAPEDEVVVRYDIDNYLTKTEFTNRKLFSTVVTALRAFRTIAQLERSRQEMVQLAQASLRFVPDRFLQLLKKKSLVDIELGNNVEKQMSVLFADIRSFTTLSEQMSLEDNFKFINSYLSRMEPAIVDNGGFIDKYLGDGIMALFEQKADDALKAAIAMLKVLAQYNQTRQTPRRPPIRIGIGINTGGVMLGTIGSRSRIDSTAIGDTVNLAARLEQLTKIYQTPLLISHHTLWSLHDPTSYCLRFIGRVQVKGKAKHVAVFEIFDADPLEVREGKLQTKSMFERALVHQYQGRFEEAIELLEECLYCNPSDAIARSYLVRHHQRALV